jgi:hypothetical protein
MSFLTPWKQSTPKAPVAQAPPPVPTVDDAAARADDELRQRRRRGRAPYVLAGKTSSAAPTVGSKTLLGS